MHKYKVVRHVALTPQSNLKAHFSITTRSKIKSQRLYKLSIATCL